jgi:hypothetical protein
VDTRTLKPSTAASYAEGIELYFRPGLGHVRLVDLRPDDVRALYAAMRKISRTEDGDRSELLRRLVAARARWHVPSGPAGSIPSRCHAVSGQLRAAGRAARGRADIDQAADRRADPADARRPARSLERR